MVAIVKQVASALAAAHAKGIVHRDLKPGNIYLLDLAGETDFVKVLDFGISKVRSATTKLTRTSSVLGTPNYMSPEQAKGDVEDIDERTDQWAVACIAWECLAGAGPFLGENVPSILFKIVHEPPAGLAAKVADLPPHVEEVLLKALAKDKGDRFANVNDFALALEAAVAGSGAPAPFRASATARSGENAIAGQPARPRWHLALAAGAAFVLLLSAFVSFRPRPPLLSTAVVTSPATTKSLTPIPLAAPPDPAPSVVPQVGLAPKEQPPAPGSESAANAKGSPSASAKPAKNLPSGGGHHQSRKPSTKRQDREGEDQWRVD